MTPDNRHWLDASLEEVLGGQSPPNLSARILAALQAAQGANSPELTPSESSRHNAGVSGAGSRSTEQNLPATGVQASALSGSALSASLSAGEPEPPPVVAPPVLASNISALQSTSPASSAPAAKLEGAVQVAPRGSRTRTNGSRGNASASNPTLVAVLSLGIIGGMGVLAYVLSRDPQQADMVARQENSTKSEVAKDVVDQIGGASPSVGGRQAAEREWSRDKGTSRRPPADRVHDLAGAGKRVAADSNPVASPPRSNHSSQPRTQLAVSGAADAAKTESRSGADNAGDSPRPAVDGSRNVANSPKVNSPPANGAAIDDQQLVAWMNQELRKAWDEAGATPAEPATDSEWCRRVFLRVLGRIPTVEEVQEFVDDRGDDKRERLVGQLLASNSKYADEFAAHWADIWTNVLVGRKSDGRPNQASREQLADHLRRRIAENRPFDELMVELLTASGSNVPGAEDYNGAVNFLLAHADDKATRATSRVSRVFLGRNLQCGQCHVDPEGAEQLAQQQFWQLNAFFRQMHVERLADNQGARLVNRDFRGDGRGASEGGEAAVFYELGNGRLRAAFPVFIDGSEAPQSGLVSEVDRRGELARMIAGSNEFRMSVVNRLWAHYLGFGIVNPVDDLSPHNPPSHPELLEQLATQFAAHRFDLREVSRWIVLSEGFGLSSKGGGGALADAPELGKPPLFSRYYARPMQVEQLYESLKLLADARRGGNGREPARKDFLGRVAKGIGDERMDEGNAIIEAIPDSLAKVDHELPRRALGGDQASLIEKVARNEKMTSDQKIDHLFQAALARTPTAREAQAARELLKVSPNDPSIGLRDLWWALLNSNEFLLDH
jgi:hypothetical protein